MVGHMFNITNGNAPTYLLSGINMNQHRYSTRARELSCVIPRVKSSEITSFLYQGVYRGIRYHLKLGNAHLNTLLNIKLCVFYIVAYLCRKPACMYVLNFYDWYFFAYLPCYFQRILFYGPHWK